MAQTGTPTDYQPEVEFREFLESIPVCGDVKPFVRRLLREMAARRADCLGVLLQVLSPGRFLPAYWVRFGVPDLYQEMLDLRIKDRMQALRKRLPDDDRLRDDINTIVTGWTDWRRQALNAGLGEVRNAQSWSKWTDKNRALKSQWDDLTEEIAVVERSIQTLTPLTQEHNESDAERQREGAHDTNCTDGHTWLVVALSKKEIGLAFGLPDDRKIAEDVNVLCRNCAILLKAKDPQQKHPRKWFVAMDTLPGPYAARFTEYMQTYHGVKTSD